MKRTPFCLGVFLIALQGASQTCLAAPSAENAAATGGANFEKVPGVVINHSPKSSGLFIGSPSIAVLTNGEYIASHDFFGPNSKEHERARSLVFRSSDRGRTWKKVSEIDGAFWSSLFVHRGALYLLGPDRHHGNVLIRRSLDGGQTWTSPTNSQNGLLRGDGAGGPISRSIRAQYICRSDNRTKFVMC